MAAFTCLVGLFTAPSTGSWSTAPGDWVSETLIVKPERHVVHVADLNGAEALELGTLSRETIAVVSQLANPDQVYVCLWSHGPVHIHFVVQPVDAELMALFGAHGPKLQLTMFNSGSPPDEASVGAFADAARALFIRS